VLDRSLRPHLVWRVELSGVTMDRADRYLASLTDEGRYRLLVEAVRDYAICLLDPSGLVTTRNPGAERVKGYTADEIIGQHFSRFYTDQDQEAGLPNQALEIAEREGKFEAENWRVRKDGLKFWAYVVIDAIRAPSGEIIGYAKITRDLTERKEAQEKLERAREFSLQAQKLEEILRREDSIDLVVTDQAMPKMTGTELAKVIRSEWPDVPVLLATGYADMAPRDDIGLPRLAKPYLQRDLADALLRLNPSRRKPDQVVPFRAQPSPKN